MMERALEKRGGLAHTSETLPESIKNYLSPRGFTDRNEVEAMIARGATLVLSILMIMSSLGNATRHALNDDEHIKQYRLQETHENDDSFSVLAPLMCGPLGTDSKIVELICSQCRTVRKRSSILSMSAQRVVSSCGNIGATNVIQTGVLLFRLTLSWVTPHLQILTIGGDGKRSWKRRRMRADFMYKGAWDDFMELYKIEMRWWLCLRVGSKG